MGKRLNRPPPTCLRCGFRWSSDAPGKIVRSGPGTCIAVDPGGLVQGARDVACVCGFIMYTWCPPGVDPDGITLPRRVRTFEEMAGWSPEYAAELRRAGTA